jgi:hypothetical protein
MESTFATGRLRHRRMTFKADWEEMNPAGQFGDDLQAHPVSVQPLTQTQFPQLDPLPP